jgi:hypothetical protein
MRWKPVPSGTTVPVGVKQMMVTLKLITVLTVLVGWSSVSGGEGGEKRYRFPTKLLPENRETYRALLDRLESNTAMLLVAFKSGDRLREDELYAERESILVACQDLMPVGESLIREGIVESKHGTWIDLRLNETNSSSFSVGHLSSPELRKQYQAVQIGDNVRFVYAEKPGLYDNDKYYYQLTELKRIGPGVQNLDIRSQDKHEEFEDTTVVVLHPDSKDDTVVILATIKNNQKNAIDLANDKQHFLKVTAGVDVEVPYHIRHRTPVIEPGKIGIILFDVSKKNFNGSHLAVRAGTRTGSLFLADINVKR